MEVETIKRHAFWRIPIPGMNAAQERLYKCLAYCYDCLRAGYDKDICKRLADNYIAFYRIEVRK